MPVLRGLTDAEAQVLGLPSGTSEATNQGEKSLNGYTAGRWKHAKTYLLPPDPKNPGKLCYQMHIGRDVHYQDDGGNWRTIDLTWRADPTNSGEFVTDQNDIYTRVSRFGVAVWDRKHKVGLRWSTTVRPNVGGRTASFPKDGLSWTWTATTSGLKLESEPIIAPRGPQTYEWRYLMIDLNTTDGFNLFGMLAADAGGNLIGNGFVTPRAFAIGNNGLRYDCGKWQVVSGKTRAVSFTFDDSTLPPEAFPYVIDPTTTFNVAASADDGGVNRFNSIVYPPDTPSAGQTNGTQLWVEKSKNGSAKYRVDVSLIRFNTALLPVGATVNSASLRLFLSNSGTNVDGRSLNVEYYPDSNWPIDEADWTDTVSASAFSIALTAIPPGVTSHSLSNVSQINTVGYTGFRLGISGVSPTGSNTVGFEAFDATGVQEPALIIAYTDGAPAPTPLDLGTSNIASASTTTFKLALAQGITPVTTAIGSTSVAISRLLGLITQATATGTTVTTTSLIVGVVSVAVAAVTSTADLTIASATITPLDMGVVTALGSSSTSVALSRQMGLSVTVQMAGQATASLRLLLGLNVAATGGGTTTFALLQQMGFFATVQTAGQGTSSLGLLQGLTTTTTSAIVTSAALSRQMGLLSTTTVVANTSATVSTFMGISVNVTDQTTTVATLKQLLGLTVQTTTTHSAAAILSQLLGLIAMTTTTSTVTSDMTILFLTVTPLNMGIVSAVADAADSAALGISMGLRPQIVTAIGSTAAGLIMNLGLSGQTMASTTTSSALPLLQGLTAITTVQDTAQFTLRMLQGISGQTTANGSANATISQLMGLIVDAITRGTTSVSLAFMGEIIVLVVNISASMPGTVSQMDQLPGTINLTLVIPNHVEVK